MRIHILLFKWKTEVVEGKNGPLSSTWNFLIWGIIWGEFYLPVVISPCTGLGQTSVSHVSWHVFSSSRLLFIWAKDKIIKKRNLLLSKQCVQQNPILKIFRILPYLSQQQPFIWQVIPLCSDWNINSSQLSGGWYVKIDRIHWYVRSSIHVLDIFDKFSKF